MLQYMYAMYNPIDLIRVLSRSEVPEFFDIFLIIAFSILFFVPQAFLAMNPIITNCILDKPKLLELDCVKSVL